MAVVNAIGTILKAIVNGIVAVFDIIIGSSSHPCLTSHRLSNSSSLPYFYAMGQESLLVDERDLVN